MIKRIKLTPEGHVMKKKEFDELSSQRVDAVKELQRAREMGDLSENAAYKVARSKLSGIDRRLRFLSGVLRRVQIIEKRTDGNIGIGTEVLIEINGTTQNVMLVDGYESDIGQGKISLYSPIGKAILGKKTGDTVFAYTPGGKINVYVVSVK